MATDSAIPVVAASSKGMIWSGRILSGLVAVFLVMDAVMKILKLAPVVQSCDQLGLPVGLMPAVGTILLTCVILYVIPTTSMLGAILLTGYLGGAVLTNLRVGNPLATHVLFPVYMGIVLWLGLYLRDARLRALVPLRSPR